MTFFRQAALLLPSAFLLGVLLFLLTHGHGDPGFGNYPFFEEWRGGRLASASPEVRFIEQSLLFFLPVYAVVLLFILGVSLGERAMFGRRKAESRSGYARAFAAVFVLLFLAGSAVAVFLGERLAGRVAPGALVAPALMAFAPFAGAAAALLPAAVLAVPLALARKRSAA
ncbi:MAG TPA: hypothetical protein VJ776_00520 [Thermoanaerobaculia bacterium]|nr:hypothetical protein [Thermoanaerobaculia bacterium]